MLKNGAEIESANRKLTINKRGQVVLVSHLHSLHMKMKQKADLYWELN